jgi:Mrp family chromosome partitioning ATPase
MENLKAVSLAFMLEDRDQPVIWRGPLKMITIKQFLADVNWGELDYLVIDSPPGTGDEPLSVCQLIKDIDGAVVVTTPQDVAILDSRKCAGFARHIGVPYIGILENMSGFVCPNCGKEVELFGSGGGEKAATELNLPFIGKIPLEPGIIKSGDTGRPYIAEQDRGVLSGILDNMIGAMDAPE